MKTILLTTLMVVAVLTYGQCPTPEKILKDRPKDKSGYKVNSQSRSASLRSGESYEVSFIAQGGMDYRISVKMANEAAGTIHFEIYEIEIVKDIVNGQEIYKKQKHVLANSAQANVTTGLEFSTDRSRKIMMNVSFSGGEDKKPQCVGVLLENKDSVKIGF